MQGDFTVRKRAILIVLGLLLVADIGLGVYSWLLASAPHTPQSEFDAQNLKLKVLRGDIKSAELIKDHMPATKKDCEKFDSELLPESTGYSIVTSDLYDTGKKAGLQIASLGFKQKEVEDRGMAEVNMDVAITGDYPSVVRFVNGLQRSQRLYILDSLALATDTQNKAPTGAIRVELRLRTYFRDSA